MKKILVPVDGSEASQKAAEKAIEIAEIFNSEVTFIHVIYVPDSLRYTRYGYYLEKDYPEMTAKMKETGEKFLDSFVEGLDCSSVECHKLVIAGQPYDEILKVAGEGEFDLIVMGRRGFSKIKRFFIGSVTQRVISDSTCPVLVVQE